MRKVVLISKIILFIFWLFNISTGLGSEAVLKLHQNWKLQSSSKMRQTGAEISSLNCDVSHWYDTTVPKTVLAALVDNSVYPDPYFSDNLKSIPGYRQGRWLVMPKDSPFYPSWWYRTEFEMSENYRGQFITLHLDGINYRANLWLNGALLADTTEIIGMFRRFEFPIDQWIRVGEKNVLAAEIFAPGRLPDIKYRTKQLEATTGWDDHNPQPPDLNMGIWQDVYLIATGAVEIKYPYVITDLDLPALDIAHLTVTAQLFNKSDRPVEGTLIGQIENIKFQQPIQLAPNENKMVKFAPNSYQQLNIKNPRLWWPHPVGPQELYSLLLEFKIKKTVSDREKVRFGIREATTYINEEGWRGYQINGKNILVRGGAWMTSDMMLNLSHKRYEALIRYAREANLNALRSEGFSIRETEDFYNLCDEHGVMVIQQIFGRSIPDEQLALQCIKDMILRIRHHPSLVHFLGHDETFPTANLDKAYRDLIAEYTPQRTYQPHSGAFEVEQRFQTGGTRTGTLELWTYANPSHYYTHREDGAWGFAQSGGIGGIVAPWESMRRMIPEKNLWPVNNEIFSFHTVLQGIEYFQTLIEAINHRYGLANNIHDFCLKGQVINYESARGMFEAYARNKYDALGITTWKYDAAWPAAITWQYADWYLNVGGGYYGAKKACEPLHVQYSYDDQSVYVLNSFYQPFNDLTVSAKLFNFDLTEKFSQQAKVNVAEDGKTEVFKIPKLPNLSTTYFLSLKLADKNGKEISDNFYWLSTVPDIEGTKQEVPTSTGWYGLKSEPKSYADFTALQSLPKVKLAIESNIQAEGDKKIAQITVKNPTQQLAFFIHLAVTKGENGDEVLPAYWSDNYFNLLPGESKEIAGYFSELDLEGKIPIVKIDGWNIE